MPGYKGVLGNSVNSCRRTTTYSDGQRTDGRKRKWEL